MSNFNDFLNSKNVLLTDELIKKIEYDNPLLIDIILKKRFEIETALNVEKKKDILVFLSKGIENFQKNLFSYYTQPNFKSITNGYDSCLLDVHFLNLYQKEYDSLNNIFLDIFQDVDLIDYSNSKANEKIIALKELGIIEFLQNNNPICQTSTNKLAELLSLLTGENAKTLQSYLNPIINNQTSQKNNPLNNTKTVEKIKDKLINIGISNLK